MEAIDLADLMEKYQLHMEMKLRSKLHELSLPAEISGGLSKENTELEPAKISVGIVGGGMAGLYSALLLQYYIPGVQVKILEANSRVGGRVFTYKFSEEPYQYFEAGAMRIPCCNSQLSFFQLVDYLNKTVPTNPIKLIDYKLSCPSGNRVLVNGTKQNDGRVMSMEYAQQHCSELGFPPEANVGDCDEAGKLLADALQPVINAMSINFKSTMEKYSNTSLHTYLLKEAGWTEERINYFEVMDLHTNSSQSSLLDILFSFYICFQIPGQSMSWKTIEGGMSRLPELCAEAITQSGGKILLNSKVESMLHPDENGSVQLGYMDLTMRASNVLTYESFDAVIMATPPSCIRMMLERPRWPVDMEHALRSLCHHPISKIGLRFNSRFWERLDLQQPPSLGGQSITDLPSRWIVYPSYGIGNSGKGIVMVFTYDADSLHWLSRKNVEKVQLVLRDLQLIYPEVDIAGQYAGGADPGNEMFTKEAFIIDWLSEWSMGVGSLCYPGQFSYLYPTLAMPRGKIYFAGVHNSINSLFLAGALDSAKMAVQQLVSRNYKGLKIDNLKP